MMRAMRMMRMRMLAMMMVIMTMTRVMVATTVTTTIATMIYIRPHLGSVNCARAMAGCRKNPISRKRQNRLAPPHASEPVTGVQPP